MSEQQGNAAEQKYRADAVPSADQSENYTYCALPLVPEGFLSIEGFIAGTRLRLAPMQG